VREEMSIADGKSNDLRYGLAGGAGRTRKLKVVATTDTAEI
jgi:hypothetical protein